MSGRPRLPPVASVGLVVSVGFVVLGCQRDPSGRAGPGAEAPDASLHLAPSASAESERRPFVLFLHGLGASGASLVRGLDIERLAKERGFLFAAPDGTPNRRGQRYWNASKACCDFDGEGVSHVRVLGDLLRGAASRPEVDPARLFVVGFSNGAFMAHRLACDDETVAGIVTIAGVGPGEDDPACPRTRPLAVIHVHGDHDDVVHIEGGRALDIETLPAHPSARATVEAWARIDGCSAPAKPAGALDLSPALPGEETDVLAQTGCQAPVELWTVRGGNHSAGATPAVVAAALGRLLDGPPRPAP